MKASKRQLAVFKCWETEDYNILLRAVAGSGKTSTLVQLLRRSKTKTLFLAFNKSIQTEIQDKIDNLYIRTARAKTMHSLGLSAIKKTYKYTLETGKNFKMIMKLEKEFKHLYGRIEFKDKLLINYALMSMNDVSRMFLTDDIQEIYREMSNMGNPLPSHPRISEMWDELVRIREKTYNGSSLVIDFADMIYVPIIKNLRIPTSPEHLMIDEAQDLNFAQHRLIDMILSQGAVKKWISVGDKNQSIYGFAGASTASFDMFLKKDNVKELPLDICYRCPTQILDSANEVYDVMEGFKEDPGVIGNKGIGDVDGIVDGSLVICRNTGPLLQLFFMLLGKGRKAFLKGDDILSEIKRFLAPFKRDNIVDAIYKMRDEQASLLTKMEVADTASAKFKYSKYSDNIENFTIMAKYFNSQVSNVNQMLQYLEKLFIDDGIEGVTLCTIHKSKGLENGIVYILNENLIPNEFAISPEQMLQEENLRYVARTRASEELYWLNISKKEFTSL